jgi:aminomethyltransferase
VLDESGREIGEVTSGNYSPMLERGIALAFLPPDTKEGTEVQIDLRGSRLGAVTARPPLYRKQKS